MAVLGLILYLVLIPICFARGERALLAGFGLSLVGFAFSAYLTYREVFTIRALCSWRATSAILLTLLFVIHSVRILTARPAPRERRASAATAAGESAMR